MEFHPVWGTLKAFFSFRNLRTGTSSNTPRQGVSFSSEYAQSNCMPRQIPNTGCFSETMSLSSSRSFRYCIAVLASPTPGKITFSAARISSGSSVTTAWTPMRSRATRTDCIFPALYFMMTVFIIKLLWYWVVAYFPDLFSRPFSWFSPVL